MTKIILDAETRAEIEEFNNHQDAQNGLVEDPGSDFLDGDLDGPHLSAPQRGRHKVNAHAAYVEVSRDDFHKVLRILKSLQKDQDKPVLAKDAFGSAGAYETGENGQVRVPIFTDLNDRVLKRLENAGATVINDADGAIGKTAKGVQRENHLHVKGLDISEAARDLMNATGIPAQQAVGMFDTKRGSKIVSEFKL